MARICERDLQSHLYAGSMLVGQAMLHRDDMLDAVQRAVHRRTELAPEAVTLIGEVDAIGYDALQVRLGALMHGTDDWQTLRVPKAAAAAGAWAQGRLEPVVPDAIDDGEQPFIRPFMVKMANAALPDRAIGCGTGGGATDLAGRCGRSGLRGGHWLASDRRQPAPRGDQATLRQLGRADPLIQRARPQTEWN